MGDAEGAISGRDWDNLMLLLRCGDYGAIKLPVFKVSSRDYMRLKGMLKGDGEAVAFDRVSDTEIRKYPLQCTRGFCLSLNMNSAQFQEHARHLTI